MKRLITIALSAALLTMACTKNIHLDLKNASGLTVIEGGINDQPGPYYVDITKTLTYYDSNNVVPISGARVVLTDDAGNHDSLVESGWPGRYQTTTTIVGTVGRTYHLSVTAEGKQYDASSTLNAPVVVDSIGSGFSFSGKPQFFCEFQDPANVKNYYKAAMYVNYKKQSRVSVDNDDLNDGLIKRMSPSADNDIQVKDTIQIELNAIDKAIYTYWYSFNSSTRNSQTIAPANPISNWSNNGLGYFSAYALTKSHHIVVDPIGFHRID